MWSATRDTPGLYHQRDLAPQPGCQEEGHSYPYQGYRSLRSLNPLATFLAPLRGASTSPMIGVLLFAGSFAICGISRGLEGTNEFRRGL